MAVFVTVAQVPSITAAIVKGALEAEGLTVQLTRDGLGAVYGLQSGPFATEVQVPEEQVEQAHALLAEVDRDVG